MDSSGALGEAVAFLEYFQDLPDDSQTGEVVYPLDEVLLLSLLAVMTVGRRLELALSPRPDGMVAHHLAHPFLADAHVPPAQFPPDPRPTTIGAAGFGMDRLDMRQQGEAAHPPTCWRPVRPRRPAHVLAEPAGADTQGRTLGGNRPQIPAPLNKGILHSDSLAKYAAAFF